MVLQDRDKPTSPGNRFGRLRPQHKERERLPLIVSYRRQFLDALRRQGDTEAVQVRRQQQKD
jgi:hypothetical protein